jgi:hypothetical protein
MANNNRIFYGSQVAQVKPGTPASNGSISYYTTWYQPPGVQSVGMTTNFDTEQAFQLGAIDLYNISENLPNVEVTISKLVDGRAPLYLMCMGGVSGVAGANLSNVYSTAEQQTKGFGGLANNVVDFRLGIYDDTKSTTDGTTDSYVLCERMYVSNLNFTFPIDGTATEELTLVGNSKKWSMNDSGMGAMTAFTQTESSKTAQKLARRQFVNIEGSVLPTGVGGIYPKASGGLYFQNITVSASLGRESINELGSFAPRTRYVTFPVEVTSEFEVMGTVGDLVTAKDFLAESGCNVNYSNLRPLPININVCGSGNGSLNLYLGSGNQLTSVNYTGGDTGGGNATITYSFRNYNDFYINASGSYANTSAL